MSAELPPEILVVEGDGVIHYFLPRPATGMARLMGGALTAFGLGPVAMGAWFLHAVSGHLHPADRFASVGATVALVGPLIFVLFGCLLSLMGVWLLAGHAEIVLTAGEIRSAFRLGPLAWRGRRGRRLVRRLVVERSSRGSGPGADLASLFAETEAGRPLLLAFVYSADWLVPLAADLARRWDTGEGPLPVIERAARRATSRRWRRDTSADGKRPAPGCFLFVWGGMFFASGVFCLVMILQALVRGDPDDSLGGAYPWKFLWILFPFAFIVPGALVLLHAFNRRSKVGLSPEQLKVVEAKAPAPVDEAGAVAAPPTTPEAEYPTVPAVNQAPGTELTVRLTQDVSAGCSVAIFLALFLLCSGIITLLAVYAVGAFRSGGKESALVAGFFVLFLGCFWVILTGVLAKEFRQWRMGGHPVVEVSALPLYCGGAYDVVVAVPGPVSLRWLRVAVQCEERATYSEGTTTRTETRRVFDSELARREFLEVESGKPFRVRGTFAVPPGAMHSFKAEHNEVSWVVRVEGEARGLLVPLPFTQDYRLAVRPRRESGGKV